MSTRCLWAVLIAATCACAQDDSDVLRGPTVESRDEKSLVGQAMTGGFQRVEGRPEAAALRLLDLDDETLAAAQRIVDDRAMTIAMLLIDEIDALKEMTDLQREGRNREARAILARLHETADGDVRDPLVRPLGDVLSDEEHAAFVAILDEYWQALAGAELRGREMSDARRRDAEATVIERERFRIFQREVREGYEVSIRRQRDALEAIYNAVEPTPEQRAAMRDVLIEHIKSTRLKATPEERREAMMRLYHELDVERQELFVEYLLRFIVPDEGA